MKYALAALLLSLATPALAHPHKTDEPPETAEKKAWPFFGDKDKDADALSQRMDEARDKTERAIIRMKKKSESGETVETLRLNGEELADAARELERAIAESGVLSDMAEMFSGFAEEVEIERGDGSGTALKFGGEEMLRFKMDREGKTDDRMAITGLGRNLTVERETVREDGKTRTRIVIEMDGGDDLEIDLPSSPDAPETP